MLFKGLFLIYGLLSPAPAADLDQALRYLENQHENHIARQIAISEIPAPSYQEAARAKILAAEFRRLGLANIETDAQGNVLGWRPGKSPKTLVVAAHLDTVFPEGTDVKVKKVGNRLNGPGIADDGRGLIALLAVIEALNQGRIETRHTLLFGANVCEEGLGDLKGVKYLFEQSRHKDRLIGFISIDGTDPSRIVNGALGSKRYRVTVKGPGGHSYGNFGRPNPTHAIGRAIAAFSNIDVPEAPKTTYTVGKIGGGTSVNSIAYEAWMEIDMRSESESELDKLELKMLECVRQGVEEENRFRAKSGMTLTAEPKLVGVRYGGMTPENSPLVMAAKESVQRLGMTPKLSISSTDSNVPIHLKIPAITVGGGGRSGDHHSLNEWWEPDEAWKGPQHVLLTILGFDERAR